MQLVGDELGDAVHFAVRYVEGPADIAYDTLGSHSAEGDDLTYVVAPVFSGDIVHHLGAPVHAEVQVDVGRSDSFGIQEAFEKQVILKRIDVGDL